MKNFLLALASALIVATPALAIVGGPWDGNVAGNPTPVNPSSANGTYQGTIKGTNIAGIMMFGTGATSGANNTTTFNETYNSTTSSWSGSYTNASPATGLGSSDSEGRCLIFVNGYSVYGQMTAVVDMVGRQIAGVLEGSVTKQTETFSMRTVDSYTAAVPAVIIGGTVATPAQPSNTQYKTDQYTFNDVMNVNGTFSAKLAAEMAMPTFSGKGVIQVTQPTAQGYTVSTNNNNVGGMDNVFILTTQVDMADPVFYSVKISGVKTSTQAPTFGSAVTVSYPSVVKQ